VVRGCYKSAREFDPNGESGKLPENTGDMTFKIDNYLLNERGTEETETH
jgi:hypothetical protein